MEYAIYESATGKVIGRGTVPNEENLAFVQVPEGCSFLVDRIDEQNEYVKDGAKHARQSLSATRQLEQDHHRRRRR